MEDLDWDSSSCFWSSPNLASAGILGGFEPVGKIETFSICLLLFLPLCLSKWEVQPIKERHPSGHIAFGFSIRQKRIRIFVLAGHLWSVEGGERVAKHVQRVHEIQAKLRQRFCCDVEGPNLEGTGERRKWISCICISHTSKCNWVGQGLISQKCLVCRYASSHSYIVHLIQGGCRSLAFIQKFSDTDPFSLLCSKSVSKKSPLPKLPFWNGTSTLFIVPWICVCLILYLEVAYRLSYIPCFATLNIKQCAFLVI